MTILQTSKHEECGWMTSGMMQHGLHKRDNESNRQEERAVALAVLELERGSRGLDS